MNTSFLEKRAPSTWLALILIALAAAIIYSNIYNSPFVFDEIARIAENSTIEDLANYLSFEQLLKPRAVVDFTFALNYKFGKLNVFGYHLINVLIHVSNGFLVYLLALNIFKQITISFRSINSSTVESPNSPIPRLPDSSIFLMAFFSAMIFVTHPIQTQSVTYTVQRYTSVAAMFYMASVFFYLKARITQQSAERC